MADIVDIANDSIEIGMEKLMQKNRTSKATSQPASFFYCRICGTEIPEGRRKAAPGIKLCIDCQKEEERA